MLCSSGAKAGVAIEAQNLYFMEADGLMKTKFTDGFNPMKTQAHPRMSNTHLLVTEHTHIHTHTHARMHARRHAHAQAHAPARTHAQDKEQGWRAR